VCVAPFGGVNTPPFHGFAALFISRSFVNLHNTHAFMLAFGSERSGCQLRRTRPAPRWRVCG
jgi:hypothetical protein